jgi:hypothetical protein
MSSCAEILGDLKTSRMIITSSVVSMQHACIDGLGCNVDGVADLS